MSVLLSCIPDLRLVLGAVAAVLVVRHLLTRRAQNARKAELKARAQRKLAQRNAKLQQWTDDWAALSAGDGADIVQLTAWELQRELRSGTLTAVEVMRAFCARAKLCGEQLDVLAEEDFARAMEQAKKADEARAQGKFLGPLHGLPFSVKDQLDMEGMDSTLGLQVRTFRPAAAEDEAVLVRLLREAGAIPFARTNVQQCLMLPESQNGIFGRAKNPFDRARTCGGSSGGEGGLIAARGSPCGIGTDIGGSIRIPAHMCGVCGLLPTVGRLSSRGVRVPRPRDRNGQEHVRSSAGPMARCVDDLELLMAAWCQPDLWTGPRGDPKVPPVPWRSHIYLSDRKLKFGYYVFDGFFHAAPTCVRAVQMAVDELKAAGHEVVPIQVDFYDVLLSYIGIMSAEGNMQGFIDGLEGEELLPMYSFLYRIASMPNLVRAPLAAVVRALGQPRMADLMISGRKKSVYDLWQVVASRNAARDKYIKRWQDMELDLVVCPALGLPALPHGMSSRLNQACSYTFLYNNFGFTAGTVPVTRVRPDEETYQSDFKDSLTSDARKALEGSAGLPVGVQVVGLPYHEELVLRGMREIERGVGFAAPMPQL